MYTSCSLIGIFSIPGKVSFTPVKLLEIITDILNSILRIRFSVLPKPFELKGTAATDSSYRRILPMTALSIAMSYTSLIMYSPNNLQKKILSNLKLRG